MVGGRHVEGRRHRVPAPTLNLVTTGQLDEILIANFDVALRAAAAICGPQEARDAVHDVVGMLLARRDRLRPATIFAYFLRGVKWRAAKLARRHRFEDLVADLGPLERVAAGDR